MPVVPPLAAEVISIKRLVTAGILLPLLVLLLLKGSAFLFTLFVSFLAVAGLHEYGRMTLPGRPLTAVIAALSGAAVPYLFFIRGWQSLILFLTLFLLASALFFLFRFNDIRRVTAETGVLAFGILYIPLLLGYLVLLRTGDHGIKWLFLLMLIVMSGDSAAYYLGSRFGKRKLYPAVSPNKSIEGGIGGLLGSLAGTFIAKATFFPEIGALLCIITALAVGVTGQLGDLFESLLKRSCGVKDSGTMIPGHGGILDRLDSILFAAPAIWFFSTLM